MSLSGPNAFAALSSALAEGDTSALSEQMEEPAFERLRDALQDEKASLYDRTVLLRQALLYEGTRRAGTLEPEFSLATGWRVPWDAFSLAHRDTNTGTRVKAKAWKPRWLRDNRTVDQWAAQEVDRRAAHTPVEGDPFLGAVGFATYRSRRQRSAARAVLTTPPGATLTVVLATGEGKSLLFQLIDAVGFVGDSQSLSRGVTLVVVPTLALALDHALATPEGALRAWRSGNVETNALIANSVSTGSQGLCFVSPEAACGALRQPLLKAASQGALRAVVIDEAHMVDAWGTGFRTDFQVLSSLVFELQAVSPPDRMPRTICLSATLTESSQETLRILFGGTAFQTLSAATLRPEPDYWIADTCDEIERENRVYDALCHVPRPAILYVTRVHDADIWRNRLSQRGFSRLAVVHGRTPFSKREAILQAWRNGSLDLVVATSAFGLGINYRHVRSVVHACIPESLDRYYQEVGRGGRDGRSCLSLLLPGKGDFSVASGISDVTVIGLERGLERWTSMFSGEKKELGDDRFALRLDTAPGTSAKDIDMIGDRSSDWNARVLMLLARSGIIRLIGEADVTDDGQWQCVEIIDHTHLKQETWAKVVAPVRNHIWQANRDNLLLMADFINKPNDCPTMHLCRLYKDADPLCSRCERCRSGQPQLHPFAPEREPRSPWPHSPLSPAIQQLFDHMNRVVVTLDEGPSAALAKAKLAQVLNRLVAGGLQNIVIVGLRNEMIDVALSSLTSVAFVESSAVLGNTSLPAGPEVVILAEGGKLNEVHLGPRKAGSERLFLIPANTPSPKRPHLQLRDCHDGRVRALSEVYGSLLL